MTTTGQEDGPKATTVPGVTSPSGDDTIKRVYAGTCMRQPKFMDDYATEVIVLNNDLKLVLISSPKVDNAGCAVAVNAGFLDGPKEYCGLPHFLEHMLFMGSEKYPVENDFSDFIQTNGGIYNAATSELQTVYSATIKPELLEGLVDRLAENLRAPLFIPSGVERELEAIQSEFEKTFTNEECRIYAVNKRISNPDHPWSHFWVGNRASLSRLDKFDDDKEVAYNALREALIKFHTAHYSSNVMSVVVLGAQPLEELRQICVQRFSRVPNKGLTPKRTDFYQYPAVPFRSGVELNKIVKVVPMSPAKNSIIFSWAVPDQAKLWRQKPAHLITHLFGHEGPGSILSVLKDRGIATGLCSGIALEHTGQSSISVEVEVVEGAVTEANVELIGDLLILYLRMFKATECPDWLMKEMSDLEMLRWKFQSMPQVFHLVDHLAKQANIYPPEHIFDGESLTLDPKKNEYMALLGHLEDLSTVNVMLISDSFPEKDDFDLEHFYQVKFKVEPISNNLMSRWNSLISAPSAELATQVASAGLSFVKPNMFIPTNLDLKPNEPSAETPPKVLETDLTKESPNSSIWYRQQTFSGQPGFALSVNVTPALLAPTVQDIKDICEGVATSQDLLTGGSSLNDLNYLSRYVLTSVYQSSVMESLKEQLYDANLAAANINFYDSSPRMAGYCSLRMDIQGFSDKADKILDALLNRAVAFDVQDLHIANSIVQWKLLLANALMTMPPYMIASSALNTLLLPCALTHEELLNVVERISPETLRKFVPIGVDGSNPGDVFGPASVQACIIGNVTGEDVKRVFDDPDRLKQWRKLLETDRPLSQGEVGVVDLLAVANRLRPEEAVPLFSQKVNIGDSSQQKQLGQRKAFLWRTKVKNPAEPTSAVVLNLIQRHGTVRASAFQNLLNTWLGEKFFNDLRTRQALGYIVNLSGATFGNFYLRSFIVQSAKPSMFVLNQITTFIKENLFAEDGMTVQPKITPAEFDVCRLGTIARLEETIKSISEAQTVYMMEIEKKRYLFDSRQQQANLLKSSSYTLEQFTEDLDHLLNDFPALAVIAHQHNEEEKVDAKIDDGFADWYQLKDRRSLIRHHLNPLGGDQLEFQFDKTTSTPLNE